MVHSFLWRIQLLGELRAEHGELVITRFYTHKNAALLAYLAYYKNRSHSREALIEMLWPETDIDAGRASLSQAFSSLRRQLEPPGTPSGAVLITDRSTARINPNTVTTDVAAFETALSAADKRTPGEERAKALMAAADKYGGPLLPAHYEDWALVERERLIAAYLGALEEIADYWEQQREWGRAVEHCLRALQADVTHEGIHQRLIRLFAGMGRTAAAQKQYHELERILEQQVGEAPSALSRALADAVRVSSVKNSGEFGAVQPSAVTRPGRRSSEGHSAADPSIPKDAVRSTDPAEIPPQGHLTELASRLPLSFNRFFGREQEIEWLTDLLSATNGDNRVVTLTGIGGSGKTRLALEAARLRVPPLDGAVWFVPLADLIDPNLVVPMIVKSLGLKTVAEENLLDRVADFLSVRPALLVLDNLEQLLEPQDAPRTAGAISAMPDAGPSSLDDASSDITEIIRTLLQCAPALAFLVTSRKRLGMEGEHELPVLPLPTPSMPGTPERLLDFASVRMFVDRAQRTRPDFQITPRNASIIAALCDRLEGIPLAIELAAAWAQELTPAQMLDRYMHRFDMPPSRRRDLPQRHRSLQAAIESSYRLLSVEQQQRFARLGVFRGGWTLEAAQDIAGADLGSLAHLRERSLIRTDEAGEEMRFRMLETLREYALAQLDETPRTSLARAHAEYYVRISETAEQELIGANQAAWFERLETEIDNLRVALDWTLQFNWEQAARTACALWRFWQIRGHVHEGRAWFARVLENPAAALPTALRARALYGDSILAKTQGEFSVALGLLEESLAIDRALGNKMRVATALNALGNLAQTRVDLADARSYYLQSLDISRELNNRNSIAATLNNLGNMANSAGDYQEAYRFQREALKISKELGNRAAEAVIHCNLGIISQNNGDFAEATSHHEQSLELNRDLGDKYGMAYALQGIGTAAIVRNDFVTARSCYEEALYLSREINNRQITASLLNHLGTLDQQQGDNSTAYPRLLECLSLYQALEMKTEIVTALESIALLAKSVEQEQRAATLWAFCGMTRTRLNAPQSPAMRDEQNGFIDAVRKSLGEAEFAAAWRAGTDMTLDEAVSLAMEQPKAAAKKM